MTLGSRWVCSGSRCPAPMVTSRTRTSSFSNSTRCDSGAATTASMEGGQSQLSPSPMASPPSPDGSAQLLGPDQVARGIAEGAVANPVRLLRRLLDDLGVASLQPLEGAVEVLGGQENAGVAALGHHLGDGAALVVGDAAARRGRRLQDDGRAGLAGRADRDPAQPAVSDVAADLEAEGVVIEGQGGVRVVVREEARADGDVHGGQANCGSVTRASRFLCCAAAGLLVTRASYRFGTR